jgi:hypothetical protein
MKRHLTCLPLVTFTVILACAQNPGAVTPKPLSPLEQSLVSNDQVMVEALKKNDVDFFKRIVTDDFMGVSTDAKFYDKGDLLDTARVAQVQEYRTYDFKVLLVNDTTAIVSYDCVVRAMVYDEVPPRYQHVSDLWVKQGDQWRLKFQQASTAQ